MARERMVTRTISSAVAEVKVYNLDTDAVETMNITVTGTVDKATVTKVVEKQLSKSTTHRYLTIKNIKTVEKLYAMTEVEFLKHAVEIEAGATKVPEK